MYQVHLFHLFRLFNTLNSTELINLWELARNLSLCEIMKLTANTWKRQFGGCTGQAPLTCRRFFWGCVHRRRGEARSIWIAPPHTCKMTCSLSTGVISSRLCCMFCTVLLLSDMEYTLPTPHTPLIHVDPNQLCFNKIVWRCTSVRYLFASIMRLNNKIWSTPCGIWLTLLWWTGVESTKSERVSHKKVFRRSLLLLKQPNNV